MFNTDNALAGRAWQSRPRSCTHDIMRLLVIEDEEKLAAALKKGLVLEGYAVDCMHNGKEALRHIDVHHEDYDLIVLDIMLPEVDGVTLCKHVRAYNIAIPVLMLTAKDDVEDRVLGLDSGADDYLVKPFDFDELSARIRALLRRPTVLLPAELKVKDLVLNPATKKVTRGGKEILLTTKEFGLLEYMMRNAGQVLTREQLLSHLWDFNFDSFSNVVDVHIKNLRKKIDHGKQEKLLETIRGVGYRVKK